MTQPNIAEIAHSLTKAQQNYLHAVAESDEPYEPRHGVTANWALRHKLTDTYVLLNDGSAGLWDSLNVEERIAVGIAHIGGQRLTPLGLLVRQHLLTEGEGNG